MKGNLDDWLVLMAYKVGRLAMSRNFSYVELLVMPALSEEILTGFWIICHHVVLVID